jgi:hypothetical protein
MAATVFIKSSAGYMNICISTLSLVECSYSSGISSGDGLKSICSSSSEDFLLMGDSEYVPDLSVVISNARIKH